MSQLLDRRAALAIGLLAGGALTLQGCATAQQAGPEAGQGYQAKPLPFDPKTVSGLSEGMMVSHHDNNYAGAVRKLTAIRKQLSELDMGTASGFEINGLKREELIALNSMILHEVYFAGFAGDVRSPRAQLAQQIEQDFGSLDRWAREFSAMGKALGGGSGWVLLTWSPRLGRLNNSWAADHSMTVADGSILLALDMYEHAYAMDYGAGTGSYVDAFMQAVHWDYAETIFSSLNT